MLSMLLRLLDIAYPLSEVSFFYKIKTISLIRRLYYGERKPGRARGKPKTIRGLLEDLPTYGQGGRQHELGLNSQLPLGISFKPLFIRLKIQD